MRKLHSWSFWSCCFALVIGVTGCGTQPTTSVNNAPTNNTSAYRLTNEPAGAIGIKEARSDVKDATEVTLVGRIGGDVKPWIEGQAAFMVVDSALKPCSEKGDDACETPWDYCCDADALTANKALVKIVDSQGKTVTTDARQLLNVKELQTVVVHGRAKRDEAGNLTVLADGIYVRP